VVNFDLDGVDMQKRIMVLIAIFSLWINISANVMPHPLKPDGIPAALTKDEDSSFEVSQIGNTSPYRMNGSLTNNILVLRIDFPDHAFLEEEQFPAFHPHNEEYFRKYMEHLKNFYLDASKDLYELNYYIAPEVYTMSENLGYYGDDEFESRRRVEMIGELVEMIGESLPFRNFEALIVFHSGAGQESDLFGTQRHTLWSTFMSQNTFRNVFDPTNPDYEGIPTADGSFITKVALIASSQFHPDFTLTLDRHFEILGVLATQFGRVMGLPTLFGNVSAYGQHAGTGNYCIMGTGTWNNNGKTPPLPSAWVRYFAGWENPIELNQNMENLQVAHRMTGRPPIEDIFDSEVLSPSLKQGSTLYKINISEKEYFLIENIQHNYHPDRVLNITTNEWRQTINHSFNLLPSEEQDFLYTDLLDGTGTIRVPVVNLMKNNLRGSEWDFFIPYVPSYNLQGYHDPSGLFIWHVDEYVIDANIASNTVNANPRHRGVGLKEADGIQHMVSPTPHTYFRGGPFKAYRADNNDYLGFQTNPFTGHYSTPTAESHYGGISFEIYNMGYSAEVMTFAIRFDPWSDADFSKANYLEPFVFDFNGNGINEVHYFHSDGYMTVFEDNIRLNTFWLEADTLAFNYTFDGQRNLLIAAQDKYFSTKAKLMNWDGERLVEVWGLNDWHWTGSVVYIDDEWEIEGRHARWILSLVSDEENSLGGISHRIYILDGNFDELHFSEGEQVLSNLSYRNQEIVYINRNSQSEQHRLRKIDSNLNYRDLDMWSSNIIDVEGRWFIYSGDFFGAEAASQGVFFLHYKISNTNRFFFWEEQWDSIDNRASGGGLTELEIDMPYQMTGQPVFKDLTKNGKADIILSHANGFSAFTVSGNLIKHVMIDNPDPLNEGGSGLIAWNWANDDNVYFVGGFSRNRLIFFDDQGRVLSNLTRTLGYPIRTFPFISMQDNEVFIYQATDQGRVYNIPLIQAHNTDSLGWSMALGNYFRNGFWQDELVNSFIGNTGVFVGGENYVFPSPWIRRYHTELIFNVMTTVDTPVEISIYNIAGQLVARRTEHFIGFESDRVKFVFNPGNWSSGVYFAVLKAQGNTTNVRFAIER